VSVKVAAAPEPAAEVPAMKADAPVPAAEVAAMAAEAPAPVEEAPTPQRAEQS
jgi:hypothetical protein